MQVLCSACGARYTIADEKIPVQGARVRCRKCQAVFSIERAASSPPTPAELPLIPPTPQASGPPPTNPPAAPPMAHPFPKASEPAESGFAPEPLAPPTPASEVAPTEIERFSPAFAAGTAAMAAEPGTFSRDRVEMTPGEIPPATELERAPSYAQAPPQPTPAAPAAAEGPSTVAGIPAGLPEAQRRQHERARRLARVLASDIAIYNKEKRDRGVKDGNLVAVLGYEIKKSWEVYKERVTPELANSTPYFRDALNDLLAEGKKVF